jgi:hypothetical protein
MLRRALRFAFALALLASIVVAPELAQADSDQFQAEFKQLTAECRYQALLASGSRPLVDLERACQHRFSDLYARYHDETPHPFTQAWFAYRLAVFERVDRGAMSPIQANFLLSEYRRYLEVEAGKADAAERAARMAEEAYQSEQRRAWDENRRAYRNLFPTSPPPVNCTTTWIGGTASTTCR